MGIKKALINLVIGKPVKPKSKERVFDDIKTETKLTNKQLSGWWKTLSDSERKEVKIWAGKNYPFVEELFSPDPLVLAIDKLRILFEAKEKRVAKRLKKLV